MYSTRGVSGERHGASQAQVRAAKAKAWLYVFDFFYRCEGQKGGPATAPEDARKDKDAGTRPHCT